MDDEPLREDPRPPIRWGRAILGGIVLGLIGVAIGWVMEGRTPF